MVHARVIQTLLAVFGLVALWTLNADAAQVPAALQGAILAKALNYDQSLNAKPKIVILAGGSNAEDAQVLAKSFRTLGGSVEIASPSDVAGRMQGAGALYVFPGLLSESVRGLCVTHSTLSLSGNPQDAMSGQASIAIGISEGKPQIIVHLPRSKTEGHKLSSRLLKLAKVVQ